MEHQFDLHNNSDDETSDREFSPSTEGGSRLSEAAIDAFRDQVDRRHNDGGMSDCGFGVFSKGGGLAEDVLERAKDGFNNVLTPGGRDAEAISKILIGFGIHRAEKKIEDALDLVKGIEQALDIPEQQSDRDGKWKDIHRRSDEHYRLL